MRQKSLLLMFSATCFVAGLYSPLAVASDDATGFVQVKQIDGVWWFIGPDGGKFVSVGVNHIEPHLWLAPYNQAATLKKYGRDMVGKDGHFNTNGQAAAKWMDQQVATCRDLGFNSFGKHVHASISPTLYQDQIYYVASLETAPLAGWQERRGQGPRPDVFSHDFRMHVKRRVKEVTDQHKDAPNLIGYLYTDVPSWVYARGEQINRNDTTMIYPWLNAILQLGDYSPGKQRWIQHLSGRYASAEEAAKVWGLPVSPAYGVSWAELSRQVDWTRPEDVASASSDMVTFMPIIVEKWYAMHEELIRQQDPNHLILGDKNLLQRHYDWMFPSLKRHVDVVVVQAYGRWKDDSKLIEELYAKTGKPIVNGDGCYSFAGPNQQEWGVKGFRTGAESMEQVAEFYRETLEGMMAAPHVVGWHHCGYLEQWDDAERGDAPRNENGFLTPFERYRTVWTDVLKEVNRTAASLHESAVP